MNITVYPKSLLEELWKFDKQQFTPGAESIPLCLRCGKPLDRQLSVNAMSRYADVYICQACGMDEALRDAVGEPLPLWEWHTVSSERIGMFSLTGTALIPTCTFERIFVGPKKRFPHSDVEHPVSEAAYFRSHYDGRQWFRTWFQSGEGKLESHLGKEIDQFSNALLAMPEFETLRAMEWMCRSCAQRTDSPTDFNLFSETKHFCIWLQMVTRARDYNLYVHFYRKSQIDREVSQ